MFFRSSSPQVPIIRFNNDSTTTFSYIALGGQLEIFFFVQGSAKEVIQQYHKLIGKPQLPPFWALGWHEAAVSLKALDPINYILDSYKANRYPLEALYLSQDMSNRTQNFGYNSNLIPDLTKLLIDLKVDGLKLIAHLDSTILVPTHFESENSTENIYYVRGTSQGLFLRSAVSTQYQENLIGQRRTGEKCSYMDWFDAQGKAQTFWSQGLNDMYNVRGLHFDGVWMTDNEPFSAIQGEEKAPKQQRVLESQDPQPYFDNKWYKTFDENYQSTYFLPFTPMFDAKGPLDIFAPSLNATSRSSNLSQYDVHNLYGHSMVQATAQGLAAIQTDKRLFILSKSTFASTGKYSSSYAVSSKFRSWDSLRYSIPHVINMNMFGLTHSGSDACGQAGLGGASSEMDEELCLRWLQLTTFMPLARHNQIFSDSQPNWTGPLGFTKPENKAAALTTMHDRMQYLRLLYTCLFEANQFGGTCVDPLFFHFPDDAIFTASEGTNDTFIVAGAVKISPIVSPQAKDQTTYKSHFPPGRWVNLADLSEVIEGKYDLKDLKFRNKVNAHLMPGAIIPFQNNSDMSARTTTDLKRNPLSIIVNRNQRGAASGTILLDGGESLSEIENKTYEYYTIKHSGSNSTVKRSNAHALQFLLTQGTRGAQDSSFTLSEIVIADAQDLSQTDFACAFMHEGRVQQLNFTYDSTQSVLRLSKQAIGAPLKFSQITNIFYGSDAKKDLNLCKQSTYEYEIPADFNLTEVLSSSSGTIPLVHRAGSLPNLTLSLRIFDEGIINVKWTWQTQPAPLGYRKHFEVPDEVVNTTRGAFSGDALGRRISIRRSPFQLNFTQQTGLDSEPFLQINNFIYDDYLNWLGMQAFTQKGSSFRGIMGLGERSQKDLFYKDGVYSMWATDEPTKLDDGKLPGDQGYGAHPFFMYQNTPQHWVGVFLKQSHAQDWIITNHPNDGIVQLKQIGTGGVSDIYVTFRALTPDDVVSYYQKIIGRPVLLPQWALGWHTCKYCYRKLDDYRYVLDSYRHNNLPLEAQWADIDYMDNYRDFTADPINFGNVSNYVDDLFHNMNVKFIPIIDAGIAKRQGYAAYDQGIDQNVFLKLAGSSEPFEGQVWPNEAVFPDFFHPNTSTWWETQLTNFQENSIWFDGLWLDMNEAANFCNGACKARQRSSMSVNDEILYTPTGRSLEYKSLSVDIVHSNGVSQLDAHSYYGTMQTKATHDWFIKKNAKRPFIVERSSFAGLGKYGAKWLGDSSSTYGDMQRSVTGSMMMNLFGIPFVGGDICGFSGPNTTLELCTRWHQVGAFQPFSRNHRDCNGAPQEPFRFINQTIGNVSATDIMRDAILSKYSLVRYYYTHLFLLSTSELNGGSFYKPVFFEYPDDPLAYQVEPSENVMLGPSLKLSIKTSPTNSSSEMNSYFFSGENWCNILNPEEPCHYGNGTSAIVPLPANLSQYQVHIREGHIIPFQNAKALNPKTTNDLQNQTVDFIIHPRKSSTSNTTFVFKANGVYVNDDGKSPVSSLQGAYNSYSLSYIMIDQMDGIIGNADIKLYITPKVEATKYYNNETKCSSINQNDYLGNIYIFDEAGIFKSPRYQVQLVRPDQTFDEIGVATLDQATNRLSISTFNKDIPPICLGYIQEIRIKGERPTPPE